MLGLGAVSLQMFFYSLVSIPFGPLLICSVDMPRSCHALYPGLHEDRLQARRAKLGWVGAVLCRHTLAGHLFVRLRSTMPLAGSDALFIWFVKARAFFLDRSVEAASSSDPVYRARPPRLSTACASGCLVDIHRRWSGTGGGRKDNHPCSSRPSCRYHHYGVRRLTGSRTTGLLLRPFSL